MKFSVFTASLRKVRRGLSKWTLRTVCALMVVLLTWGSGWTQSAIAVGSEAAADIVTERAARELDRVAGAGTSDQIEGKAKRDIGRVKQSADQAANAVDEATDDLQSKVSRDVDRAQSAADDIGDQLEDKANSIVDSVKDLFD